jgi:hypothetical protein
MEFSFTADSNFPKGNPKSFEKLDWKQYEAYVAGTFERLMPGTNVRQNVRLTGVISGEPRQVDVLIERSVADLKLTIAVDCKCYHRKVNVNDVERVLGMLHDLRVSKGVIMTTRGYSKTALKRAERDSRDIDLRILSVEQLSEYQGLDCALPFEGEVGALVVTPSTWVLDNEPRHDQLGAPHFAMYPLGHARDFALADRAFIYGKIVLKWHEAPTMEAMAKLHERRILEKHPTATFERLPQLERLSSADRDPAKTLFRVGYIHAGYKGPEYSLYIDHPKGVLLLVLLCPEGQDKKYVPILKFVGRYTWMLNVVDMRSQSSQQNDATNTSIPRMPFAG